MTNFSMHSVSQRPECLLTRDAHASTLSGKRQNAESVFSEVKQDPRFVFRLTRHCTHAFTKLQSFLRSGLQQAKARIYRLEHYEACLLPSAPQDLKKIQDAAGMATIPYTRDSKVLTPGFSFDQDLACAVSKTKPQPTARPSVLFGRGQDRLPKPGQMASFIDPHSGLSAYLVVNDSAREIKVIFGGTTSGEKVAIDYSVSRLYLNKPSMFNQCVANLKAGLGRIPLCYQQGACITRAVLQQVQAENSRYAGYTVSTLGHSLGGGIAVYAALAQAQPVQAIGFSSAHLSLGIVNRLPKENVANAKNLITHFHVKNDVVPNLRYLYPGLAPVGVEAVFPSSPEVSGVGHIHAQFYEHIKRYSH